MSIIGNIVNPIRLAYHAARKQHALARVNPQAAERSLSRIAYRKFCEQHPELGSSVSNRYEAARLWQWGDRSHIYSWVNDARFDAGQADLREMLRKARYFEQNCPLVQKLADVWTQYIVGPNGIRVISDSEDREWVAAAKDWYDEWCIRPELSSRLSMPVIQALVSRLWLIDGECFILLTRTEEPPFQPRIQIIEAHRVATPGDMSREEGVSVVNGVRINPRTGAPLGYYIREGFTGEEFTYRSAESVIHVGEPNRAGLLRYPTMFYAVMNCLHDLDDLARLEMQAAKEAASVTKIIKTPSGELPDDDWQKEDVTTAGEPNPAREYYERRFGAETKVMFSGDEYEQFISNRPSVAQQWYWRYLTEQVCTGGPGIPLALVYPESMQGTVARGVYDQAAQFFRAKSATLGAAFRRVRNFALDFGSRIDARIADKPADWRRCTTLPPKQSNVDTGRNSSAVIAELEAGVRTFKDVLGELQQDYRETFDQKAREAAEIAIAAKKWNVTPQQVLSMAINEAAAPEAPKLPPVTPQKKEAATV